MPASVTCPSCRSDVSIPADHAEPSIRCGICWNEVDLGAPTRPSEPSSDVPAPLNARPTAVAKRPSPELPGKPLPGMAKLEERLQNAADRLAPPSPSQPVRATVVAKPAAPLVEIEPAIVTVVPDAERVDPAPATSHAHMADDDRPARPSRSGGTRRRYEEDDEDDYDDRPRRRRREKPKGSPLPLILGIVAGILVLVGGIYLIARATRGPSDRDFVPVAVNGNGPPIQFNLPNVDQNPGAPPLGFNLFPNRPGMNHARKPVELVDYQGEGYTAKMVGNRSEFPTFLNVRDDAFFIANVRSKRVIGRPIPPLIEIEITTTDAPRGVTPNLKKMLSDSGFRRGETNPVKWAGQDGFEQVDDFAGRKSTSRVVQVGCRVFLAKVTINGAFGDAQAAEAAQKEFFDSFVITFDPMTPPPAADPGIIPKNRFPMPRPPKDSKPKSPGQP